MRALFLTVVFVAASAPAARADVVTLRNGVKMTGVLTEDESGLTLRVSDDGYVGLDSATVVGVMRASRVENEALVASWKATAERETREDRDRAKYDDEQRAKGYVWYQGEWMTPAQFDRRLALDHLEIERQREERLAATRVSYSYHYYYTVPTAQFVYQSFGTPARVRAFRACPSPYAVPLAPAGVRTYGVRPSLFDREPGMGAHSGW